MQIVILAAGRGERMGELTAKTPKPMLKIKGKPILAHKLEMLPAAVEEVIFVVGYLGEQIRKYFGDEYAGKKISYVQQEQLKGSGAAVHLAKELLRDDFLVMMGDDLYSKDDVAKIVSYDFAIVGLEITDPKNFGIISLDDQGNMLETIESEGISGKALVNTGLYKLQKKFFDYAFVSVGKKGECGLPQTLSLLAKDIPVKVVKATVWLPIGTPQDLEKAQDLIDKFKQ